MIENIVYHGLGFPILIRGIETKKFQGDILPVINHRELEDRVFKTLLYSPFHFSSAHLAFVRGYMGMSQKAFASTLRLKTHSTISAWESKGDRATGMNSHAEVVIRLLMADYINDKSFAEHFKEYLSVAPPPNQLEVA